MKRNRTLSLPPGEPGRTLGRAGGEKSGENVGRLQSELASEGSSVLGEASAAAAEKVALEKIPSACKVALSCKLVAEAWKCSWAESRCCRLALEVLSQADSRWEAYRDDSRWEGGIVGEGAELLGREE